MSFSFALKREKEGKNFSLEGKKFFHDSPCCFGSNLQKGKKGIFLQKSEKYLGTNMNTGSLSAVPAIPYVHKIQFFASGLFSKISLPDQFFSSCRLAGQTAENDLFREGKKGKNFPSEAGIRQKMEFYDDFHSDF